MRLSISVALSALITVSFGIPRNYPEMLPDPYSKPLPSFVRSSGALQRRPSYISPPAHQPIFDNPYPEVPQSSQSKVETADPYAASILEANSKEIKIAVPVKVHPTDKIREDSKQRNGSTQNPQTTSAPMSKTIDQQTTSGTLPTRFTRSTTLVATTKIGSTTTRKVPQPPNPVEINQIANEVQEVLSNNKVHSTPEGAHRTGAQPPGFSPPSQILHRPRVRNVNFDQFNNLFDGNTFNSFQRNNVQFKRNTNGQRSYNSYQATGSNTNPPDNVQYAPDYTNPTTSPILKGYDAVPLKVTYGADASAKSTTVGIGYDTEQSTSETTASAIYDAAESSTIIPAIEKHYPGSGYDETSTADELLQNHREEYIARHRMLQKSRAKAIYDETRDSAQSYDGYGSPTKTTEAYETTPPPTTTSSSSGYEGTPLETTAAPTSSVKMSHSTTASLSTRPSNNMDTWDDYSRREGMLTTAALTTTDHADDGYEPSPIKQTSEPEERTITSTASSNTETTDVETTKVTQNTENEYKPATTTKEAKKHHHHHRKGSKTTTTTTTTATTTTTSTTTPTTTTASEEYSDESSSSSSSEEPEDKPSTGDGYIPEEMDNGSSNTTTSLATPTPVTTKETQRYEDVDITESSGTTSVAQETTTAIPSEEDMTSEWYQPNYNTPEELGYSPEENVGDVQPKFTPGKLKKLWTPAPSSGDPNNRQLVVSQNSRKAGHQKQRIIINNMMGHKPTVLVKQDQFGGESVREPSDEGANQETVLDLPQKHDKPRQSRRSSATLSENEGNDGLASVPDRYFRNRQLIVSQRNRNSGHQKQRIVISDLMGENPSVVVNQKQFKRKSNRIHSGNGSDQKTILNVDSQPFRRRILRRRDQPLPPQTVFYIPTSDLDLYGEEESGFQNHDYHL